MNEAYMTSVESVALGRWSKGVTSSPGVFNQHPVGNDNSHSAAHLMAHELRNPLSSLKMAVQIIGRDSQLKLDANLSELHQIALNQIAYMEEVITDTLAHANGNSPELEWVCINKLLVEITRRYKQELDTKKIGLTTHYHAPLPRILAAPSKLGWAFSNLFANALYAVSLPEITERKIAIHTGLTILSGEKAVELRICDTGCGIDAQLRDQLFEPLVTTRADGIGLGLAIVKQHIEQHRGTVTLEPGFSGGACAVIRLPIINGR